MLGDRDQEHILRGTDEQDQGGLGAGQRTRQAGKPALQQRLIASRLVAERQVDERLMVVDEAARKIQKWGRWDSNPEPTDYESAALTD